MVRIELNDILKIETPETQSDELATFAKTYSDWLRSSDARHFAVFLTEKAVSREMRNKLDQLVKILPVERQREYFDVFAREAATTLKNVEVSPERLQKLKQRQQEARAEFEKIVGKQNSKQILLRNLATFSRNYWFWLKSADAQQLVAHYAAEKTSEAKTRLNLLHSILPSKQMDQDRIVHADWVKAFHSRMPTNLNTVEEKLEEIRFWKNSGRQELRA